MGDLPFTGSTATITSESASNAYPINNDWPQVTAGISMFGPGTIESSAETLTITATSTGAGTVLEPDRNEEHTNSSNFAGFVVGLNAEGGTINLQGDTTVRATGNGAYAAGMTLMAVPGDSDFTADHQNEISFDLTATFGGDLTVTAFSETGGAEGINLGGYVPGDEHYGITDYPDNVKVTLNTSATGTTTITATSNSDAVETVGVNFVYPDPEGSEDQWIDTPEEFTTGHGYLNLNGKTIITADHALKGDVGFVTNKGDLTLNGRVDQFKGNFTQTAGSTTLNDATGGFFGGSTVISGGTLSAPDAVWDSTVNGSLSISNAEATLNTISVGETGGLSLSGAAITANILNVDSSSALETNGTSIVLNGVDGTVSQIASDIRNLGNVTVNGGRIDVVPFGSLHFNPDATLTFNNGAVLSYVSYGEIWNFKEVVFNDGTTLYRPDGYGYIPDSNGDGGREGQSGILDFQFGNIAVQIEMWYGENFALKPV